MAVVLCLGLMGAAFAYFSDTETSSGNTFTAGTVDLEITGQSSITLDNMAPGATASGTITVTNIGTLAGSLYATSWYVTADGAVNPVDMSDDDVAKMLLITAFTADDVDILSQIPEVDGGAGKSVYDMVNDPSGGSVEGYDDPVVSPHGWYSYDANMIKDASHTYALTVQFDPLAGNDYQGDGITWTLEFLLTQ